MQKLFTLLRRSSVEGQNLTLTGMERQMERKKHPNGNAIRLGSFGEKVFAEIGLEEIESAPGEFWKNNHWISRDWDRNLSRSLAVSDPDFTKVKQSQ